MTGYTLSSQKLTESQLANYTMYRVGHYAVDYLLLTIKLEIPVSPPGRRVSRVLAHLPAEYFTKVVNKS